MYEEIRNVSRFLHSEQRCNPSQSDDAHKKRKRVSRTKDSDRQIPAVPLYTDEFTSVASDDQKLDQLQQNERYHANMQVKDTSHSSQYLSSNQRGRPGIQPLKLVTSQSPVEQSYSSSMEHMSREMDSNKNTQHKGRANSSKVTVEDEQLS